MLECLVQDKADRLTCLPLPFVPSVVGGETRAGGQRVSLWRYFLRMKGGFGKKRGGGMQHDGFQNMG